MRTGLPSSATAGEVTGASLKFSAEDEAFLDAERYLEPVTEEFSETFLEPATEESSNNFLVPGTEETSDNFLVPAVAHLDPATEEFLD